MLNTWVVKGIEKSNVPAGQWAAVYEGKGCWRVQGAVVVRYEGDDYYYSTTWAYASGDNQIELIGIHGSGSPRSGGQGTLDVDALWEQALRGRIK